LWLGVGVCVGVLVCGVVGFGFHPPPPNLQHVGSSSFVFNLKPKCWLVSFFQFTDPFVF